MSLLAWLAQLVPIGSVAFRANLLSAVLVSGALATTVAILLRLGVRPVLAAAAALALGAVPTVWAAATVAEVNPLHLLFVALLLHRALVWEERRRPRDLVIGALLLGLALGNHLLIVFVAPFLALFVLWVGRREIAARPRILAPAVAAGLLGLERLPLHPARRERNITAPVQPPRHARRGPVARRRHAVPRPVRVPVGERAGRVRGLPGRPVAAARGPGDAGPADRGRCSAWSCSSADGRHSA